MKKRKSRKKEKVSLFVIATLVILIGITQELFKGTYSDATISDVLSIYCPNVVDNNDNVFKCSIELNSDNMIVKEIKFNYNVSDELLFDSFLPSADWDIYTDDNSDVVMVNLNGFEGDTEIGVLSYKVLDSSIKTYNIGLKNIQISDGEENVKEIDNVSVEAKILSYVNTLEDIVLSDGILNEKFDKSNKNYTASVNVDSLMIKVTKTDDLSVVSGDGEVKLHYGTNKFDIEVISESGDKNIYTLNIYRNYEFKNDVYLYNKEHNYLYVGSETDNDEVLNNLNLEEGLNKQLDNGDIVISYQDEELLRMKIISVNFNKYNLSNKEITINYNLRFGEFIENINISDELSYSLINNDDVLTEDDIVVNGMKFKIYYDSEEIDSYSFIVLSASYSFDELIVEEELKYIKYVKPMSTVEDLLSKVTVLNGEVKVYDSSDIERGTTSNLATGDKLVITGVDGIVAEYIISVMGDSNGDGKVSLIDLVHIRKHIVGWVDRDTQEIQKRTGIYYYAIDMDQDGNVGLIDLVRIRKIIVGLE